MEEKSMLVKEAKKKVENWLIRVEELMAENWQIVIAVSFFVLLLSFALYIWASYKSV